MANYLHINSIDLNYDPNALLNAVIAHLNLKNDAALSRILEVAPPVISKIRHAKLLIGATLLINMHVVTGIDIKQLRALMGDRRPSFHDFEPVQTKTIQESPAQKSKEESDLIVALYRSMNSEGQEKLIKLSQHMVNLSDLTQEKTAPVNYVMTKEFDDAAKEAVRKAVDQANAHGLPRAYVESIPRPEVPVIVTISGRVNHG